MIDETVAGTGPSPDPPPRWADGGARALLIRFVLAVLLALVAVGVLIGWVVERQVQDEHERFATFHAVFVRASVLGDTVDALADGEVTATDMWAFLTAVDDRVLDDVVRRVRVWAADGTVIASDDRSMIGQRFPEAAVHLSHVVDEPVSYVGDLDDPWLAGDVGMVERAFVTLLPLGDGVTLEVLQDHAPTQAAVDRFADALSLSRALGLALVFVLVLPIALGASRRLRMQAQDLEEQATELRRALAVEQEAGQRLRELDQLKNTFLTAVSHELRTPLTVVKGLASTLRRRDGELTDEQRRDLLERVDVNAERLDQLLRDLLDVDHLTRGVAAARRVATDVRALVHRAVDHVDRQHHRIMVDVPSVMAMVDPAQVERVVENLVANAVRHTPPGTRIDVVVRAGHDDLELLVEDDGPGVASGLRQVIFEPFAQGPIADAHAPGTGIGLSLVARFAELHDGRAWVDESFSGGAAFHVLLRGTSVGGAPEPAAAATPAQVTPAG